MLFYVKNLSVNHLKVLENIGYSMTGDKKVEKWIKVGNGGIQMGNRGIQWKYGGNRLITKSKPLIVLKQ